MPEVSSSFIVSIGKLVISPVINLIKCFRGIKMDIESDLPLQMNWAWSQPDACYKIYINFNMWFKNRNTEGRALKKFTIGHSNHFDSYQHRSVRINGQSSLALSGHSAAPTRVLMEIFILARGKKEVELSAGSGKMLIICTDAFNKEYRKKVPYVVEIEKRTS